MQSHPNTRGKFVLNYITNRARQNILLDDREYLVICIFGNINRELCDHLDHLADGENIFLSLDDWRKWNDKLYTEYWKPSVPFSRKWAIDQVHTHIHTHIHTHTHTHTEPQNEAWFLLKIEETRSFAGWKTWSKREQPIQKGRGDRVSFPFSHSYREIFSAFVLSFCTHGTVVHVVFVNVISRGYYIFSYRNKNVVLSDLCW